MKINIKIKIFFYYYLTQILYKKLKKTNNLSIIKYNIIKKKKIQIFKIFLKKERYNNINIDNI